MANEARERLRFLSGDEPLPEPLSASPFELEGSSVTRSNDCNPLERLGEDSANINLVNLNEPTVTEDTSREDESTVNQPTEYANLEEEEFIFLPSSQTAGASDDHGISESRNSDSDVLGFSNKVEGNKHVDKEARKERKKKKALQVRIEKEKSWQRQMKRAQRFLGLRPKYLPAGDEQIEGDEWTSWEDYQAMATAKKEEAKALRAPIDLEKVAAFPFENSVLIISLDIEANERNHKQVTEVGLSMLDTNLLHATPPGENGKNWIELIEAHHVRTDEYKHIVNHEFVGGNPNGFEFGESEFISIRNIPKLLSSLFSQGRNVVMVGHGIHGDFNMLRAIGFDITNHSNHIVQILDTVTLYNAWKKIYGQIMSLAGIMQVFDFPAWNLHNAGNDAYYTLEVMIAMTVCARMDQAKEDMAMFDTGSKIW
ncbi:MAG: hypothetical protein M1834_000876 [Cirrosporium novae-zelandiae]|nr:MAG: hypothetical protein M1834_000876 [Cirrosporium novae-zelandiae]